jgi:hypothetical protein
MPQMGSAACDAGRGSRTRSWRRDDRGSSSSRGSALSQTRTLASRCGKDVPHWFVSWPWPGFCCVVAHRRSACIWSVARSGPGLWVRLCESFRLGFDRLHHPRPCARCQATGRAACACWLAGRRRAHRVNVAILRINSDMRFIPKIQLIALARLMHLSVPRAAGFLVDEDAWMMVASTIVPVAMQMQSIQTAMAPGPRWNARRYRAVRRRAWNALVGREAVGSQTGGRNAGSGPSVDCYRAAYVAGRNPTSYQPSHCSAVALRIDFAAARAGYNRCLASVIQHIRSLSLRALPKNSTKCTRRILTRMTLGLTLWRTVLRTSCLNGACGIMPLCYTHAQSPGFRPERP